MAIAKQHHITDPQDRVPIPQMIGYGLGAVVTIVAVNMANQVGSLFYVMGLGMSPILLGYAGAIPRLWDAVTDPLAGNISDNTRSRFGRRIPYIFIAGILVGITFILLWLVPRGWSDNAMFIYFLAASILFFTMVTFYAVPHSALGMEMTPDYHERTRVFSYASFLGNIAAFVSPWVYYFANRSIFDDEVHGMRWVCSAMAVIMMIFALTCAFLCREPKLSQTQHQQAIPFWQSVKTTCRNRTFLMLVTIFVLIIVGFHIVTSFNNYIMVYYVFSGNKEDASGIMGWNGTIWALTAIAGIFPLNWMSSAWGKRKTVFVALLIMIAACLSKIFCYNRDFPWLTIIPTILLSFGMVIVFTLVNAMIADVCDEDELVTYKRREGSYTAVYGWSWKMASSLALVIGGYITQVTGFAPRAEMQTEHTLFWLRAWEISLPALFCIISIILLCKYPLTEQRAYEVKQLLEQRRKQQRSNEAASL